MLKTDGIQKTKQKFPPNHNRIISKSFGAHSQAVQYTAVDYIAEHTIHSGSVVSVFSSFIVGTKLSRFVSDIDYRTLCMLFFQLV